jgi:hypothetical protein
MAEWTKKRVPDALPILFGVSVGRPSCSLIGNVNCLQAAGDQGAADAAVAALA